MVMQSKLLEQLRKSYPASHLHSDVTLAGQNSYRIVVAVIDGHGEVIASIDHYGSGDIDILKEQAYQCLHQELEQLEMV
jgi:hypothetical protein